MLPSRILQTWTPANINLTRIDDIDQIGNPPTSQRYGIKVYPPAEHLLSHQLGSLRKVKAL